MADDLSGKRIAILATDGVEQVELERPRASGRGGRRRDRSGLARGRRDPGDEQHRQGRHVRRRQGRRRRRRRRLRRAGPAGRRRNPDKLRMDEDAVAFVKAFFEAGKPVGAICHAPWTLVEADLVRDRTLTSYPSLRTDIRNAGGNVVDEEVVVDEGLVTSRNPGRPRRVLREDRRGVRRGPPRGQGGGRDRLDPRPRTAELSPLDRAQRG